MVSILNPHLSRAPDSNHPFCQIDGSDSSESNVQRIEKVTGTIERRSNSERKRNVKITSFRSLIESKIFSKSDKELERIGLGAKSECVEPKDDVSIALSSGTRFHLCFKSIISYRKIHLEMSWRVTQSNYPVRHR